MTILVGVVNDTKAILASDAMAMAGDRLYHNEKKIRKFNNFMIGFSGTTFFRQVFEMNIASMNINGTAVTDFVIEDTIDCYELWRVLHDLFKDFGCQGNEVKGYVNSFDLHILIVTKQRKIFEIDGMGFVTELNGYGAAGSGWAVGTGCLEYAKYFDKDRWRTDLENIVEKTINIVSRNSPGCGGDYVYIESFTDEEKSIQCSDEGEVIDEISPEETA